MICSGICHTVQIFQGHISFVLINKTLLHLVCVINPNDTKQVNINIFTKDRYYKLKATWYIADMNISGKILPTLVG